MHGRVSTRGARIILASPLICKCSNHVSGHYPQVFRHIYLLSLLPKV